ncbi:hypothetical protein TNCV_2565901 [Trichonephila clavipes]|nr:hypothetical protein TNCV_2565901 [Trichonephila clavipes]
MVCGEESATQAQNLLSTVKSTGVTRSRSSHDSWEFPHYTEDALRTSDGRALRIDPVAIVVCLHAISPAVCRRFLGYRPVRQCTGSSAGGGSSWTTTTEPWIAVPVV